MKDLSRKYEHSDYDGAKYSAQSLLNASNVKQENELLTNGGFDF